MRDAGNEQLYPLYEHHRPPCVLFITSSTIACSVALEVDEVHNTAYDFDRTYSPLPDNIASRFSCCSCQ
jgi:hypothetical protein